LRRCRRNSTNARLNFDEMMRRILVAAVGCSLVPWFQVFAQTHKVAKPESVVRAVGVYEWTGDIAKPAASRFIPVTVFIDGELQDGGVYLARPVPFALQSGNYYELEAAGVAKGGLELAYARHLQAVETATGATEFDDGWFGYGSFKPLVPPKKSAPLRVTKDVAEVKGSKDDGRPHFGNKSADSKSTDSKPSDSKSADSKPEDVKIDGSASSPDADRPTMRRRSASGDTDSTKSTSKTTPADNSGADAGTPADDPDRPKLTKKSGSSDSSDPTVAGDTDGRPASTKDSGSSTTTSTPTTAQGGSSDDPDRPTLKRRSVEDMKKDRKREDSASVSGVGSLNNDPDRPNLHRGKPTSAMTEDDLPKLKGLPPDLKQMVAVSDAANRPVHEFARPWEDDKERSAVLAKMQVLARAKLAEYGARPGPAVTAAPEPKAAAARRTVASKHKPAAAPEVALADEELKGYLLSYGGAPTYVYTAHTMGVGADLDYVTVVAQADAMGELKPAMTSVTDAAHLDRTPRMRFVDAVDAEASNRASLLFELRGQRSRQFGLYSVIGARANQKFLSGSTQ
jgi:hypothetical protein